MTSFGFKTKTISILLVFWTISSFAQNLVQRSFTPSNTIDPSQETTITVNLVYDKSALTDLSSGSNSTIVESIPAGLVSAGVVPANATSDNNGISLDAAISAATGEINFAFQDDEDSAVITFSYELTIPAGTSGDLTFPSTNTSAVQINYFTAGFDLIAVTESIGGGLALVELSDPGLTSSLEEPANAELNVPQANLSTEVSNGSESGNFTGTFTATGAPNKPTINTLEFRVVMANAGGPPWEAPGTIDDSNSPTLNNGNEGWITVNIANPQSPVNNTANNFDHTFDVAVDTSVADNVQPTISWTVPNNFVNDPTVYIMQFRATASFETNNFEEIIQWAFNVVDEPLPIVAPFDISTLGGDNTGTPIGPVNVSASDANDPDSAITFKYEWLVNGSGLGEETLAGTQAGTAWTATIPALASDQFKKGDTVQLSVSAMNDIGQQGPSVSSDNPNEIGNTPPSINLDTADVSIEPASPVFDSGTLTATISNLEVTDPDTEDTQTNVYQWQRSIDGGEFSDITGATGTSLTTTDIGADKFDKGDQFQVVVSVTDGTDNSTNSVTSDPVTIGNSAPVVNGVIPEGASETVTSTVLVMIAEDANNGIFKFTVNANDPDDDTIASVQVSDGTLGTVTPSTGDTSTEFTYEVTDKDTPFTALDTINITATDDDDTPLTSQTQPISINYINDRLPILEGNTPAQTTAKEEKDPLEFSIIAYDPDNENPETRNQVTKLEWFIGDDSQLVADPVPATDVPATFTLPQDFDIVKHNFTENSEGALVPSRDDVPVIVKAVASDENSTESFEWTVTVSDSNRKPSLAGVQLTAEKPVEDGGNVTFKVNLSGPATDEDEEDGEYLQYTYTWKEAGSDGDPAQESTKFENRDGADAILTDSFTTNDTKKAFVCEVTVSDGFDSAEQTLSVTVALSPAWLPTLSFAPIPKGGESTDDFETYNVQVFNLSHQTALNGAAVVNPDDTPDNAPTGTASDGKGFAALTVKDDGGGNVTFDFRLDVQGIPFGSLDNTHGGNDTAVHIHRGGPTERGGIIIDVQYFAEDTNFGTVTTNGSNFTFDIKDAPLTQVQGGHDTTFTPAAIVDFLDNSEAYITVHDNTFPTGTIRGNFTGPSADPLLDIEIDGTEVGSTAYFDGDLPIFDGFLPGQYEWFYRGVDSSGQSDFKPGDTAEPQSPGNELVINYEPAEAIEQGDFPANEIEQLGGDSDEIRYGLKVTAGNARGVLVRTVGQNTGIESETKHVFTPKEDGTIPLNEETEVIVPIFVKDMFDISVAGFNPIDEAMFKFTENAMFTEPLTGVVETPAGFDPFIIGPLKNSLIDNPDQAGEEICLRWAPRANATSYIVHLSSTSGQVGVILNQENVGNTTELCFTVVRSGNTVRFTNTGDIPFPGRRSIPAGANLKFDWWVVAIENGDTVEDVSDLRSFTVVENSETPIIDSVRIGDASNQLIFTLANGSAAPDSIEIFLFDGGAWSPFNVSVDDGSLTGLQPGNEVTATVEGATFATNNLITFRALAGSVSGDITDAVLD